MNLTIKVGQTPRVYVERIDVTGNTTTRDKVIRREFRLNEGDAFNAQKVKRSQDRIKSLGYFDDKFEIKQSEGSAPDRIVLAQCDREADGPVITIRRLFELGAVRHPARPVAEQFPWKRPSPSTGVGQLVALFEIGDDRMVRPVFPRQADFVRSSASSGRITAASIISGTTGTRHTNS